MTREALLAFMRSERYAVQASVSTGHSPGNASDYNAQPPTIVEYTAEALWSSDSDRSGDR